MTINIVDLIIPLNIALSILSIDYLTKGKEYKYFAIYFLVAAVTEVICFSLSKAGIHNLFLFHFFVPAEFILLGLAFTKLENEYKDLFQSTVWLIGILITTYCLTTPFDSIPFPAMIAESLVLLIFAARSFFANPNKKIVSFLSFGVLFFFSQNAGAYYFYKVSDISIPLMQVQYVTIVSLTVYIIGMFNARNRSV